MREVAFILIGVDIGTTSICGVLLDAANGRIVKSITKENTAGLPSSETWEFTQDASVIWDLALRIVGKLRAEAGYVSGIGVTGQMHGILYVDEAGAPVSPLYTWQDRRGGLPGEDGVSYVDRLRRLTGYPVAAGFGMATHYYQQQHGLVPERAAALCTIPDYVAMRLAGLARPATDPTNAAGLGLYDLRKLGFDLAALQRAGIDPDLLPKQVPSGTVIGRTPDGIPVVSAIGDNQASFLGAVRNVRSSALLNVGTGSQISAYADRYSEAEEIETRPFPGGGYLLVGASLSGGKSYAMLERLFREICILFSGTAIPDIYAAMNLLAEDEPEPGSKLTVNTSFFGTRADPHRLGTIGGIGPANLTARHLIVGVLEGMAEELHGYFAKFPSPVKDRLTALVASGNGVRSNDALRRMLEKRFGLPLEVPEDREEASRGAALCAGVGVGIYPGFIDRE
ncbi:hypothetical protein H7B90_23260 [Cohnella xylanilytica]|uniref:Sedoheptulokinase n=1 Tax=Cohnella xylanilytica TaxID=557555 RepID=A0A841U5F9_9BACL|nr:FGGY family carbohydrate kinase [Cohnella xylanilytica]MBB6694318.1 hypothetical protein [Cohnella xylanilytica]